ncbi:hypothetical protein A3K92_05085 [Thermococcus gorgonarius]|uniref:Uncharacterized protein n=2 Tax=Thermococcus gorgonarius TaxID=71997 RepID=A0A2Z2M4P3_THEGO|nr:hypothetical protein A3K92_05085 [Thermococcus gorgonarius]
MRKALTVGILLLLFSFFAYNAYTYHQLSPAEGAYRLVGIPKTKSPPLNPYIPGQKKREL